jgi:hypothetical protein
MIVDPERYPRFYTYRQRLGWKEVMQQFPEMMRKLVSECCYDRAS